ncbi:MGH1-like glycoside hydrolase domain-containing protein [Nakamurella lactea]|uniref:MGH1-like glycoside hydrolase domain-containing protein n=1 Tax=Nakamurella lactea TaxID=459515 RepID=UPI0003F9224A|nr:glycosyl hydrolase family 65 protein [Nakamurella lactea]
MTSYALRNAVVSAAGDNGTLTELRFDPAGKGRFGPNLLTAGGLRFELDADGSKLIGGGPDTRFTATANRLRIENIPFANTTVVAPGDWDHGYDPALQPGVGQSFTAPTSSLGQLGLGLYVAYGVAPTRPLQITVRSDGPTGAPLFVGEIAPGQLATPAAAHPAVLTWIDLGDLECTPGATYFFELRSDDSGWGVLFSDQNGYDGGQMYADGLIPNPAADLVFALRSNPGVREFVGTWDIRLDRSEFDSTLTVTAERDRTVSLDGFRLTTAWAKAGYDTTDPVTTPFSQFFDSTGQYIPIELHKRRPAVWGEQSMEIGANSVFPSSVAREWIHFSGQNGYDLRFGWHDIKLNWIMTDATMTHQFQQNSYAPDEVLKHPMTAGDTRSYPFRFSVRPAETPLPTYFPTFESDHPLLGQPLTRMFRDRGFSYFAGNVGTDWKEWMSRILDWTGSPLRDGERRNLEGITLDEDGYVWTWNPANTRGWPFPDPTVYDTRHFTTNPLYIVAAARYYAWTGDTRFLRRMMPKVRRAMEFLTRNLNGASGLVTVDAPGGSPEHTGRDNATGINYWDLISHGHLDAYTNLYFYAAARAMYELECEAGGTRAAQKWQQLADRIRASYNETFWNSAEGRYVQAVDVDGKVHDYGSVYVNTEAMAAGLPTDSMGASILDWLDNGATEVTENLILLGNGSAVHEITEGQVIAQEFDTSASGGAFAQVAVHLFTYGGKDSSATITVRSGGIDGEAVSSVPIPVVADGGFHAIDVPNCPPGHYTVEVSDTVGRVGWLVSADDYGGRATVNGAEVPGPLRIAVVSPYRNGPADIITKWGFTPRTTSRKNNFWYLWAWQGVIVPWGDQLEDGGGDLYLSGYDIMARARYSSAADAFGRVTALLDRYLLADRLCGGSPLIDGIGLQNEIGAGPVGVDFPFPESGMAPVGVLYGVLGIDAEPHAGLTAAPNLPSEVGWVSVDQVHYRGRVLKITVRRSTITVRDQRTGRSKTVRYRSGKRVRLAR